ncbi:hypothetical protein ILP97_48075 [Amycolatopsis sp. H6(2020)]|nr:hypothetical protein [Amycolatopsis sp. H6(2020)]
MRYLKAGAGGNGDTERGEQVGELAVQLHADRGDLRIAEAREAGAGLIDGEPHPVVVIPSMSTIVPVEMDRVRGTRVGRPAG